MDFLLDKAKEEFGPKWYKKKMPELQKLSANSISDTNTYDWTTVARTTP
jgi:hypothetical protein